MSKYLTDNLLCEINIEIQTLPEGVNILLSEIINSLVFIAREPSSGNYLNIDLINRKGIITDNLRKIREVTSLNIYNKIKEEINNLSIFDNNHLIEMYPEGFL